MQQPRVRWQFPTLAMRRAGEHVGTLASHPVVVLIFPAILTARLKFVVYTTDVMTSEGMMSNERTRR